MTIAQLRHRVDIEQPSRVSDGIGGGTISWTPVKTVWARIETAVGNERKFADKLEANVTHVITCRALSVDTVNSTMRIKFKNRIFQIRSVVKKNEIEDLTWIMAIEGVAS